MGIVEQEQNNYVIKESTPTLYLIVKIYQGSRLTEITRGNMKYDL